MIIKNDLRQTAMMKTNGGTVLSIAVPKVAEIYSKPAKFRLKPNASL